MDQKVGTHTIYIISDSTGDLGSRIAHGGLEQFRNNRIPERRFLFVRSMAKVKEAMELAREHHAYVVYTLVDPDLREYADSLAKEYGVKARSLVMGDVVQDLAEYLGEAPLGKPGHRINAAYFEREEKEWDALKFAIEHDDGQRTEDILDAEVVIVGVSRVRKSQVSKELALKGFMVANIPIAVETGIPAVLHHNLDPRRVFALTMRPARLQQIRSKRLASTAKGLPLPYADMEYIRQDLAQVDRLVRIKGWTIIDGTDRGIEETAAEIAEKMRERFPQ